MNLRQLIKRLKQAHYAMPDAILRTGFNRPHSYRGYYEQLSFEPAENIRLKDMLDLAIAANGATYEGWKGGSYTMDLDTTVWIASEGCTSPHDEDDGLTEAHLEFILSTEMTHIEKLIYV